MGLSGEGKESGTVRIYRLVVRIMARRPQWPIPTCRENSGVRHARLPNHASVDRTGRSFGWLRVSNNHEVLSTWGRAIRYDGRTTEQRLDLSTDEVHMERIVNLHIEKLPEGVYIATSDVIQGLVVQGRTIQETIEIARDVAKKLLEATQEREGEPSLPPAREEFDYPLIVNA